MQSRVGTGSAGACGWNQCPAVGLVLPGRVCCEGKTLHWLCREPSLHCPSPARLFCLQRPGHRGGGWCSTAHGSHPRGTSRQVWPRLTMSTLLSFQVTSASLEAPAATHPPAREPEPWLGTPAESLLRGPKTAQELGPARCQQSSLDGAGPDLAGTGRCQLFVSRGLGVDRAALAGRGPKASSGSEFHPVSAAFWLRAWRQSLPYLSLDVFVFIILGD